MEEFQKISPDNSVPPIGAKVRLEHSRAILISFEIVVIFNILSADFALMSADVVKKNCERDEDCATVL